MIRADEQCERMAHMKENQTIKKAIIYSLLLHMVVLFFLLISKIHTNKEKEDKKKVVWIDLNKVPDQNQKQIVESFRGKETTTVTKDAFLSDKNRQVENQSVTKEKMRFPEKGKSAQAKGKSKSIKSENNKTVSLSQLGVKLFKPQENQIKKSDTPNWADVGRSAEDYVKGVNEGKWTALNTKEFVYFSYFQRIRKQLDQAWRPLLQEHLSRFYRHGKTLVEEKEHVTQTVVVLDSRGEIIRVQVIGESGVQDLDQAAVQAFQKAGPFPNPPTGLIESSNLVKIRWDFILKT